MAFPSVAAATSSFPGSNETSHTVDLPSGISSGDLLVVDFNAAAGTTITFPAGWEAILDSVQSSRGRNTVTVAHRKADGTEGSSITVTTADNTRSAHRAYRITGAEDPSTQAPEQSNSPFSASSSESCPSLTPTGGAKDYLWLVFANLNSNETFSSYPTNYTGTGELNTDFIDLGWAQRDNNTSTENPGSFTWGSNADGVMVTVAVHPGGGGGTPVNVDISAGTLSLTGASQSVQAGAAPQMGAGSLSFTGQAQTVAAGATADIGAGSLTLTGQPLTVTHGVSAQIGAGSLNLTGQSLTVTASDKQTVSVDISPGTLNLSGSTLAESHGVQTDIGAGTLTLSGLAAQIAAGAAVDVQAGTLSLTGQSLDSAGGVAIDVQAGHITLSGQAITETYGHALDIGAGTLTLTGQSLSVVIAQVETPDGRTLTIPMDARTLRITADHRDIAIPDEVRSLTIH